MEDNIVNYDGFFSIINDKLLNKNIYKNKIESLDDCPGWQSASDWPTHVVHWHLLY